MTTRAATQTLGNAYRADLSDAGQSAVDANNRRWGITQAALEAELESGMTPASIAQGKAWYPAARAFNADLAERSGLTLEQVTAITAAISPRMNWPANQAHAERVAMTFREFDHVACAVETAKIMGGMLSANLAKAIKIARGADIKIELTGIKRQSFYDNMINPAGTGSVTVDTHMQRVAMFAASVPMDLAASLTYLNASRGATGGTGAGYVAIAEATRAVAARHGMTPDQVQAAYWIAVSGSPDGVMGRTR